jgi:hypothetical protein
LISILSLLDDAEVSSAANVDASVMLRKDPENYKRIVKENVEQSRRDIPDGFQMPTTAEHKPPPKEDNDDDFWCDSESDFGADSDEDMIFGPLTITIDFWVTLIVFQKMMIATKNLMRKIPMTWIRSKLCISVYPVIFSQMHAFPRGVLQDASLTVTIHHFSYKRTKHF